jgi:hypothetical protein
MQGSHLAPHSSAAAVIRRRAMDLLPQASPRPASPPPSPRRGHASLTSAFRVPALASVGRGCARRPDRAEPGPGACWCPYPIRRRPFEAPYRQDCRAHYVCRACVRSVSTAPVALHRSLLRSRALKLRQARMGGIDGRQSAFERRGMSRGLLKSRWMLHGPCGRSTSAAAAPRPLPRQTRPAARCPQPRVRLPWKILDWALENRRWDLPWSRARCVQYRIVVTTRALAVGSPSHAAHYRCDTRKAVA